MRIKNLIKVVRRFTLPKIEALRGHADSHDREAFILSTVQAIKLLTVATEPSDSFAVGTESTKI